MSKFQWIAVILAVIFLAALFAFGTLYLKQENERLRLLRERVAGLNHIDTQTQADTTPTPEPTPTVIPPKTSDFTNAPPDGELTRAMFTAMLAALEGIDLSAYTETRFDDVPEDEWYSAAVAWAADMGIVNGIGGGMFAPDAPIHREQIAVMLCNYMRYKDREMTVGESPEIRDYADICGWALESVDAIRAAGIVPDRPDNTFDPHGSVTNAEADAIFERLLMGG